MAAKLLLGLSLAVRKRRSGNDSPNMRNQPAAPVSKRPGNQPRSSGREMRAVAHVGVSHQQNTAMSYGMSA